MLRLESNLKLKTGTLETAAVVDVIFLLLLFFLLSSNLVFQQVIPVDLPAAASYSTTSVNKMILTVTDKTDDKTGEPMMFFDDQRIEWSDLEREFREVAFQHKTILAESSNGKSQEQPQLILKCDTKRIDRLIEIFDIARLQGVQLLIAVKPIESGKKSPKVKK